MTEVLLARYTRDGRLRCPACGDPLVVVPTAYGERATCGPCEIRWTRIREHDPRWRAPWVAERR